MKFSLPRCPEPREVTGHPAWLNGQQPALRAARARMRGVCPFLWWKHAALVHFQLPTGGHKHRRVRSEGARSEPLCEPLPTQGRLQRPEGGRTLNIPQRTLGVPVRVEDAQTVGELPSAPCRGHPAVACASSHQDPRVTKHPPAPTPPRGPAQGQSPHVTAPLPRGTAERRFRTSPPWAGGFSVHPRSLQCRHDPPADQGAFARPSPFKPTTPSFPLPAECCHLPFSPCVPLASCLVLSLPPSS